VLSCTIFCGLEKLWTAFVGIGECPTWADGVQDTILFREGQLRAEIDYLHDNPRRLAEEAALAKAP